MKRFFFDVDDGSFHKDMEGTSLRDEQAAEDEALRTLTEMARDLVASVAPPASIKMWVRDERSRPLLELSINMTIKRVEQPAPAQ